MCASGAGTSAYFGSLRKRNCLRKFDLDGRYPSRAVDRRREEEEETQSLRVIFRECSQETRESCARGTDQTSAIIDISRKRGRSRPFRGRHADYELQYISGLVASAAAAVARPPPLGLGGWRAAASAATSARTATTTAPLFFAQSWSNDSPVVLALASVRGASNCPFRSAPNEYDFFPSCSSL